MLQIKARAKKGWSASKLRRHQETSPWLTRAGLIAAVKAVRKHCVCGYRGDRCDCKFGIRVKMVSKKPYGMSVLDNDPEMVEEIERGSEQTGCPELYTVIELLEKLTNREFNDLVRRPARPAPKVKR